MLRFLWSKSLAPACLPLPAAPQPTPDPRLDPHPRRRRQGPGAPARGAQRDVRVLTETAGPPARPGEEGGGARETSWKVPHTHESVRPQLSPGSELLSATPHTQPLLRAWLGARVAPALLLGPGAAGRGRSPGNLRAPPAPGQSQGRVGWCEERRPLLTKPHFPACPGPPAPSLIVIILSLPSRPTWPREQCYHGRSVHACLPDGAVKVPVPSRLGQDPKRSPLCRKGVFLGGGERPRASTSSPHPPSRAWRKAPKAARMVMEGGGGVSTKGGSDRLNSGPQTHHNLILVKGTLFGASLQKGLSAGF